MRKQNVLDEASIKGTIFLLCACKLRLTALSKRSEAPSMACMHAQAILIACASSPFTYPDVSRGPECIQKHTWEELMIRAPAVRKAEMMGRDNRLHRNPRRRTASSRYSTATIKETCSTPAVHASAHDKLKTCRSMQVTQWTCGTSLRNQRSKVE